LVSSPIEGGGRFLGLLLSFFSPSHGLSLSRSVSLCLSARESKGRNKKEGEQRRKEKEGESCCGLEEKHRRWRVSASSSFFFFFFFFFCRKTEMKKRICAKNERGTAPPFIQAWKVEINWARIDPWLGRIHLT
jgi:hypothetical protein